MRLPRTPKGRGEWKWAPSTKKTWPPRDGPDRPAAAAGILAHGHQGAEEPGASRALTCLLLLGRNSPEVLKRRERL